MKYGGQPGYQYVVEYPGGESITLENKLTFLFKGQNEFQINCQSSEKNREALNEGCDQILETLEARLTARLRAPRSTARPARGPRSSTATLVGTHERSSRRLLDAHVIDEHVAPAVRWASSR